MTRAFAVISFAVLTLVGAFGQSSSPQSSFEVADLQISPRSTKAAGIEARIVKAFLSGFCHRSHRRKTHGKLTVVNSSTRCRLICNF